MSKKKTRRWFTEPTPHVPLEAQSIWDAFLVFEPQYDNGRVWAWNQIEQYISDFVHWLITQEVYNFHLVVGDKKAVIWIREIATICIQKHILDWKTLQYINHGKDYWLDDVARDRALRAYHEGKWTRWEASDQ